MRAGEVERLRAKAAANIARPDAQPERRVQIFRRALAEARRRLAE